MQTMDRFSALVAFSNDLAAAVESAAAIVVAVNGRPRTPSTGIIWRKGVVVTTDHTLRQDEDITITLNNGESLAAMIAGRDPATDLAVLNVPELDAAPAVFADNNSVRLGHVVLALARGVTASLGVVSAVSGPWRTWRGAALDQYIRPDVAIYTGFSGGPLINAQGQVIGINTSGLSRGGAVTIPVATVNRVVDELSSKGRVARGYLGIGMQPVRLQERVRSTIRTRNDTALIVLSMESGAPADKAGVLIGDILLELDGAPLAEPDDLQAALSADKIGKAAILKLIRAGVLQETSIIIGERP